MSASDETPTISTDSTDEFPVITPQLLAAADAADKTDDPNR